MEKKKYAAYGMLLAGTALLAVGVQNFLEPMELVAGGISGLGMILDDVSRRLGGPAIPLWLVNTALNVPLFLLAWYAQGRQFLGKTILTSLLFSVMLYIASRFPMYHGDLLTAAAYGGVLMGAGLGLVLRGGATTGGVDLAAALLHDSIFHHVSVARLVLFLDGSIILLGLVTFGPTHTLYAILAVGIMEKVYGSRSRRRQCCKGGSHCDGRRKGNGGRAIHTAGQRCYVTFGYGKLSGKRTKCAVLCFFAKRPFSGQKSYHEY